MLTLWIICRIQHVRSKQKVEYLISRLEKWIKVHHFQQIPTFSLASALGMLVPDPLLTPRILIWTSCLMFAGPSPTLLGHLIAESYSTDGMYLQADAAAIQHECPVAVAAFITIYP